MSSQKNRTALAEQAVLLEDQHEPGPTTPVSALDVSTTTMVASPPPPSTALTPEQAVLREARQRYKRCFGFKPVGLSTDEILAAVQRHDLAKGLSINP